MTLIPPPIFSQTPVVSGRIYSRPQKRTQLSALWAVFCCLLFTFAMPAHPQGVGDWSWMGGSSSPSNYNGQPEIYGTQGTFAAGNTPASRYAAARWTDTNGNLWLFGGYGIDANGYESGLNDLWEFNSSTNEWAWIGGSIENGATSGLPGVYGTLGTFAAGNIPGTRYGAVSWIDKSGNFWLFGGLGYDGVGGSGWLNDLWEFSPSTKEWAWISGSDSAGSGSGQEGVFGTLGTFAAGNVPGGRQGATGWIDKSGNLWLFGGTGFANSSQLGYLNDLWEFNPSTKEWAWMSGSSTMSCPGINGANCGAVAVYGTLGKPAAGNLPGALTGAMSWIDTSGNLWLFGGALDQSISNAMWEFSPSTKEWTWMGGSSADNQPGVYGTLGTAAAGNIPGSRMQAVGLTDSSGNFWIFGGTGYSSTDAYGDLDDLWKFNPSTNEWAWIDGSSAVNPAAEYGIFGTPAADNTPGGRQGASGWFDDSGNLWIFGGYSSPNDLWKYQISTAPLPAAATPTFSVANGTYTAVQSVKISDTTAGATIYYSTNAASETPVWTVYSGPIAVDTTESIEAIAMASGHSTSVAATAAYTINLPAAATPTFSLPGGTFTTTQTVTISDATAGATIYYTTNGTVPTTSSPVYTGAIEISSSETIEAIALAPSYSISAVASATYNLEAIPTFVSLSSSSNPSNVSQYVTFYATVTAPAVVLNPTGSVQFSVNGVAAGSPVPISGNAKYTTAALFAGSNSITATYIPAIGSGYAASTATLVQSIAGNCAGITATTLSSSQNPSTQGQPVTLSATVAATAIPACVFGTPATGTATYAPSGIYGTVQFTVNGVAIGSPVTVSSGTANVFAGVTATYTTSSLPAGSDVVSAVFTEENGYFGSSTATGLGQVVNGSGFVLSSAPSALTIDQGSSATSTITVTGNASLVTLAALGLPSGVTATFSPNPTTGTSVLTLTVSPFAATGNSTITISGTSGGRTVSIAMALTITAAPFTLSISPTYLSVAQCGSGLVTLTQADLAAGVNYTFTGLPSGVTATIDPVPTRVGVTIYTIAASCSAVPQLVTVTVTGTYGGQTETATFALSVFYPVSASPASLTIPQSGKGASTIEVSGIPVGKFPSGVTFEATNLPMGVTASFGPASTINTSVLTLMASSTATAGTYTVTISAIGNLSSTLEVLLGSTSIALTVTPATPPSTCTINYVIQPQNSSTFGANITINNTGTTALTSWTLSWTFANGQIIPAGDLWNGNLTQTGANVTVTNLSYNGSIAAGASYNGVGFNGTWNGVTNAVPTAISLNGMACVVN